MEIDEIGDPTVPITVGEPTTADKPGEVVIVGAPAEATSMVMFCTTAEPPNEVGTVNWGVNVPLTVGVPTICPRLAPVPIESPGGKPEAVIPATTGAPLAEMVKGVIATPWFRVSVLRLVLVRPLI